jgi:hypothetical protein
LVDIRFNDNGIETIDTFQGIVTRNYLYGRQQNAQFVLTDEDRRIINKYAASIGLEYVAIPSDEKACGGLDEISISFPALIYELEFSINGKPTRKLIWGNNEYDNPTIKKVQAFSDSVRNLILRKPELRDLEKSDMILL